MPIGAVLDWGRCADGFELVDYGNRRKATGQEPPTILDTVDDGQPYLWFRPRSEAAEPVTLEVHDVLEHALVLRFIEVQGQEALLDFVSEHGTTRHVLGEQPLELVQRQQLGLQQMLHHQNDPAAVFETFNQAAPAAQVMLRPRAGDRPTLMLQPSSLYNFMAIEAAIILAGESELVACQHCGRLFLRGGGATRRHAVHCSRLCRNAASRARRKARG